MSSVLKLRGLSSQCHFASSVKCLVNGEIVVVRALECFSELPAETQPEVGSEASLPST
jgi:hypothetical protein